jgi:hypothetical protein
VALRLRLHSQFHRSPGDYHIDRLRLLHEFEACVAYKINGKVVEDFPASVRQLDRPSLF